MAVWQGCRVLVRDSSETLEFEDDDVELTIEEGSIRVVYWDDEGPVVFGGTVGDGEEFALVCRSRPRTATLSWSADQRSLVGVWSQGDEQGSWTIVVRP